MLLLITAEVISILKGVDPPVFEPTFFLLTKTDD